MQVVDGDTGGLLSSARAIAGWGRWVSGETLDWMFDSHAVRGEAGVVFVTGPSGGEGATGAILAGADGYASKLVEGVAWPQGDAPIRIELARGSVLRGAVRDVGGGGVAGVLVTLALGDSMTGLPRGWQLTGSVGEFQFDGLAEGAYKLYAGAPFAGVGGMRTVALGAGEERTEDIELPTLGELACTIRGLGGLRGASVLAQLDLRQPVGPASMMMASLARWLSEFPVGVDGQFVMPLHQEGRYRMNLMFGAAPRTGAPPSILLGTVTTDAERSPVVFDGARLGRVHGRVTIEGAAVPSARLVAQARAAIQERPGDGTRPEGELRWAAIEPDGSFELELAPGRFLLDLVDVGTGVILGSSRVIKVHSGQRTEVELEAAVTELHVNLVPPEGGRLIADRLDVQTERQKAILEALRYRSPFGTAYGSPGVDLADGAPRHRIYVPPGPVRLRLQPGSSSLGAGAYTTTLPTNLGSIDLIALPDSRQTIEIQAQPPPKLDG